MKRALAWFLPVAVVASVFVASTARAETAPADAGCSGAEPLSGSTLPANAPGIPFRGRTAADVSLMADDGTVVSTKLVGAPVPNSSVLQILDLLKPGTGYTLGWDDDCGWRKTRRYVAIATGALPTSVGSMRVSELIAPSTNDPCDAYGEPIARAMRLVYLDESPELQPFLALSAVEVSIDGQRSPTTWGAYHENSSNAGTASMSCPAAPRLHRITVRVHIAGGPTLESDPVDTELRCLAQADCREAPSYDAGGDPYDPGYGEDSGYATDGGWAEDAAPNDLVEEGGPPKTIKATCTAARGSTGSDAFATIAFAAVVVASARRRR